MMSECYAYAQREFSFPAFIFPAFENGCQRELISTKDQDRILPP
jgi:hypothetical protein